MEISSHLSQFRNNIVDDELCQTTEETVGVTHELEDANKKLKWSDEKECSGLSVSVLCKVYQILWIKKFSKVLLKMLKHFNKCHPNIVKIDNNVGLSEDMQISDKEFGQIV